MIPEFQGSLGCQQLLCSADQITHQNCQGDTIASYLIPLWHCNSIFWHLMPDSKEEGPKEGHPRKKKKKKSKSKNKESKMRPSEHRYYLNLGVFLLLTHGPDKKTVGSWPCCPSEGISFSHIWGQCFLSSCKQDMSPRATQNSQYLMLETNRAEQQGSTRTNESYRPSVSQESHRVKLCVYQ